MGDGGVGKSAITIQFIQGRFEEEYGALFWEHFFFFDAVEDPTIEDTYQKFTEIDKKKVCLNVVDTAGYVSDQIQIIVLTAAQTRGLHCNARLLAAHGRRLHLGL